MSDPHKRKEESSPVMSAVPHAILTYYYALWLKAFLVNFFALDKAKSGADTAGSVIRRCLAAIRRIHNVPEEVAH
jgi:hypothetical protein